MPQYWVLNVQTQLLGVWIVLENKNDTNTPAISELWVLEVGTGLGRRGKEPARFPDFKKNYL